MYRGAKAGQIVYVTNDGWRGGRLPAEFIEYRKDNPFILHPNIAVVRRPDTNIITWYQIKDVYKKDLTY